MTCSHVWHSLFFFLFSTRHVFEPNRIVREGEGGLDLPRMTVRDDLRGMKEMLYERIGQERLCLLKENGFKLESRKNQDTTHGRTQTFIHSIVFHSVDK